MMELFELIIILFIAKWNENVLNIVNPIAAFNYLNLHWTRINLFILLKNENLKKFK